MRSYREGFDLCKNFTKPRRKYANAAHRQAKIALATAPANANFALIAKISTQLAASNANMRVTRPPKPTAYFLRTKNKMRAP